VSHGSKIAEKTAPKDIADERRPHKVLVSEDDGISERSSKNCHEIAFDILQRNMQSLVSVEEVKVA
jgi:hypothetical protein